MTNCAFEKIVLEVCVHRTVGSGYFENKDSLKNAVLDCTMFNVCTYYLCLSVLTLSRFAMLLKLRPI